MRKKIRRRGTGIIGKFEVGGRAGAPSLEDIIKQLELLKNATDPNQAQSFPTDGTPVVTEEQVTLDPNNDKTLPNGNVGDPLGTNRQVTPTSGLDTLVAAKDRQKDIKAALDSGARNLGLVGMLSSALANTPGAKPDVGQAALGGALQGASAGAQLGGPLGAGLGALIGGIASVTSTGDRLAEYNRLQMEKNKQRGRDRRVDPFQGVVYAEEGGYMASAPKKMGVMDSKLGVLYAEDGGDVSSLPEDAPTEVIPAQTEVGEVILMPSGVLADVKARLPHTQMEDDDVTDILPEGSFVFSNSKKSLQEITQEIRDSVIGYGTIRYSETEDTSEVGVVRLGDVIPSGKKLTFADMAKGIRDKFSVVRDQKDVFTNVTNADNLAGRVPFLQKLITWQNAYNGESVSSEQLGIYGKGGRVRKFEDGTDPDDYLSPLDKFKKQFSSILGGNFDELLLGATASKGGVSNDSNGSNDSKGSTDSKLSEDTGMGLNDLVGMYKKYIDEIRGNVEKENLERTQADEALFKRLRDNNVVGHGIVSPLGTLLQNPYERPAYKDANLAGAMFRPSSTQAVQGIANQGIAQANSLAKELMAQGYTPSEAIAMTEGARTQALAQANELNYKALMANDQLEREKYKFLTDVRDTNNAADVAAFNKGVDNQNKQISELAGSAMGLLKDDGTIATSENTWRTQRAKDYYSSIEKVGSAELDYNTKAFQVEQQRKQADERMQALRDFLDGMSGKGQEGTDDSKVPQDTQVSEQLPTDNTPVTDAQEVHGTPLISEDIINGNVGVANGITGAVTTPAPAGTQDASLPDVPKFRGDGGWQYYVKNGELHAVNPKSKRDITVDPKSKRPSYDAIMKELERRGKINPSGTGTQDSVTSQQPTSNTSLPLADMPEVTGAGGWKYSIVGGEIHAVNPKGKKIVVPKDTPAYNAILDELGNSVKRELPKGLSEVLWALRKGASGVTPQQTPSKEVLDALWALRKRPAK